MKTLAEFDRRFDPEFLEEVTVDLALARAAGRMAAMIEESKIPLAEIAKRVEVSPTLLTMMFKRGKHDYPMPLSFWARLGAVLGHDMYVVYEPKEEQG